MVLHQLDTGSLSRSDGSATYSAYGCTIVASVNGPVEVTRRDELAEAATIDVAVRPAAGVGGIRERHFESILHRTLRRAIKIEDLARTLVQVTLQITTGIDQDATAGRSNQADPNLYLLPLLLNAAVLALLTTSIPLEMTPIATFVAVALDGSLLPSPSWSDIQTASSIHAFAFNTNGQLLLVESAGSCDFRAWKRAAEAAMEICLGVEGQPKAVESGDTASLEALIRKAMGQKIRKDRGWAKLET